MKRKILNVAVILAIAAVLLWLTSGCSSDTGDSASASTEKIACIFVVGYHANAQVPNLSTHMIQDATQTLAAGYGYAAVISVDGSPELVLENDFAIDDRYKNAAPSRLELLASQSAYSFLSELETVAAPNNTEVDYLKAIQLAARQLASLEGYDEKTIIVVGTGLDTTGALNFTNNLLLMDPEAVVKWLESEEELPNLENVTVNWQGLADVAAPQGELTSAQRKKLISIWSAIIEAAGGVFRCDESVSLERSETGEDLPEVSVVELPESLPLSYDDSAEDLDLDFETGVTLTEETVGFLPDEATYLHESETMETLTPIAKILMANEGLTLLLCGTTAGDVDTDSTVELSLARADAVKQTLIELGVNESQIQTIGLGCDNVWHVDGLGYSEAAQINRSVVLIDAASDIAQSILSSLGA